tara:strand:+ start:76 stop:1497 length:1422 start_codon:yes stop_codon:yes gene_type:complete
MGDSGPSDSQAGDDPAFEGDEGVGYGNVNTTTQQFQDDQRQENQRSNIVDSSSYDAQFTADNLEARGLNPSNFMSSDNYAQTTQAARESGFDTPSISVPTVQTAGTSPTFAQSASIFDPDLGTMTGRRDTAPRELETGVMAPEQRGTPSVDAFGTPITVQSFLPADVKKSQLGPAKGLSAVAEALGKVQEIARDKAAAAGIDFGVTAPVASTVGDDFGPALDMVEARTQAERARAQDPDANIDPFVSFDVTGRPGTTATGVEDPFDPNVGKPFDVERLEQMERLQEPTLLERAGIPSVLGALDPERISKDRMATSIALGRPVGVVEGFNFTAPNMAKDKETIEEYNKRISARIPDSQLIKDNSGMVIGIRDASGRLVEGVDPNAQEQRADDNETQVKKRSAKPPTDPCPEGYMLIDGKCTIIEDPNEGTGFLRFPTDRNPPFKPGPFTPSTVATGTGGIRALNPITFNNPFRT